MLPIAAARTIRIEYLSLLCFEQKALFYMPKDAYREQDTAPGKLVLPFLMHLGWMYHYAMGNALEPILTRDLPNHNYTV